MIFKNILIEQINKKISCFNLLCATVLALGIASPLHAALVVYEFSSTVTSITGSTTVSLGEKINGSIIVDNQMLPPLAGEDGRYTIVNLTINSISLGVVESDGVLLLFDDFPGLGDFITFSTTSGSAASIEVNFVDEQTAAITGGELPNPFPPLSLFETNVLRMAFFEPGPWGDCSSRCDVVADLDSFNVVPIPAAIWLFGSGLIGLIGIASRKKV